MFSTCHALLTFLNDVTGRPIEQIMFPSAIKLKDSYELKTCGCVKNSIFLCSFSIRPEITFKTTLNILFREDMCPKYMFFECSNKV